MIKALLALGFLGLLPVLEPEPPDGTFELKIQKIKVNKNNQDVFPEIELRPQESLVGIAQEPKYKSKYPQRFVHAFGPEGERQVAFAADEKRPGKGYAQLIIDSEGKGQLKKAKKLSGKPVLRGSSYEDTEFGDLDIVVPVEGGTMKYPVHVRYSVKLAGYGGDEPDDSSLYISSRCVLSGAVIIGEQKRTMIIYDANCNGVFGEKGTPGGKKSDKIWIGKGAPKLEDAYIQAMPIGKYFLFEGSYYEIALSPTHTVEIKKTEVPLGKVQVSQPDFLLELSEAGDVLCVSADGEQELDMPTGDYDVTSPGFRRKGKGGVWELEGKPGTCKIAFEVKEGEETQISLGPPLKVIIDAKVKNRGATGWYLSMSYRMEGAEGEEYAYLLKNGKKTKLPEVSIRNSRGKEVKKGRFEYGRGGTCSYSWRIPSKLKNDDYSIIVTLDTGPYELDEEHKNGFTLRR